MVFAEETVNFYPFRVGSIGAYGPVAERIKVHCFFAKTIGTVPVLVGSVPFLLCRVNAPYDYKCQPKCHDFQKATHLSLMQKELII